MTWVWRAIIALAGLVLLLVLVVPAVGVVTIQRGAPQTTGEITLAGLHGPVEVLRDEYGIPTIVATTSDDLFRAQGFVHAQDRFWEMDFRRHVTAGRLSELFGSSQVDTDAFVRTLGWRRVAEAELALLEDETLAMLEAYADGVNAWMDGRTGGRLSLEHALLPLSGPRGYTPEPWTPADSVAWLKAMAWDLRSNLEDELLRARLLGVDLGEGRDWQALFPAFPDDRHPPILPDGGRVEDGRFVPADGLTDPDDAPVATPAGATTLDLTDPDVMAVLAAAHDALDAAPMLLGDGGEDGIGSNSWVVGPERSATGTALLSNDPHLGPTQPSLWYQVGLRCEPVGPDCPYHVLGYSFSGLPGIIIGQTDRVAWGFTNLGADVADLVIERLDGDRYLTEDGWEPLEIHTETIAVAGDDDVELTVRATRNGPLFSDVSGAGTEVADGPLGAAGAAADDEGDTDGEGGGTDASDASTEVAHAVALRWVALDPVPNADAVPYFMRSQDWASFREAARRFQVPSQNLVYADVDGHIGYQAPGRIPVRSQGDGTLPLPGWTGEATWERFLDFEELPWAFDPADGLLITANQPIVPPGTEPFLSRDHNVGYRAARITELLADRDQLTLDDLLEVQLDAHNGNAATLVPVLLAVEPQGDDRVAALQDVLRGWDLQDAVDSAGGAAFNATWRHLLAATFHDELPEWAWPAGGGSWWEVVRGLVEEPDSPWWDDRTTPERETRDDILHLAMATAHEELADRFGSDPERWRWGAMHTLTLTHQTFGSSGVGPVERLFNRGPFELAGGSDIPNATGWSAPLGYEVNWVPSMRYLVDLGDLDAGSWIHISGQSGRPFTTHYTDQAEPWVDGQTLPLRFTAAAVEEATTDRLVLRPADGTGDG